MRGRGIRIQRTPKALRQRGQTDARKCRHIKAKRVQPGMSRVGWNDRHERIIKIREHHNCAGELIGVSIYTDRYPEGLYYAKNSFVPVV